MRNKSSIPKKLISIFSMILVALTVILIESFILSAPENMTEERHEEIKPDSLIRIRVLTTGDAMAHLPQTTAALNPESNSYAYDQVFRWISPFVKQHDLSIINLETTLAGPPYKGYPQFSAPDQYARDLKEVGFNLFCCANNHAVDRYNKGILRTITVLDSFGIAHTGIFRNKQHRDTVYPMLIEVKGIRIVLLNATYGTNGLEPKLPVLVNRIDKEQIKADIAKARTLQPDLLVAVMHWGAEYKRFPDPYQKGIAGFLAQEGVDVIVGHHPHVIQPVEWIHPDPTDSTHKMLVIWSLGNFYSNQRDRYRDGGMFVNFDVVKNIHTGKTTVEALTYYPFWVWRSSASTSDFSYKLLPANLRDSLVNLYELSVSEQSVYDTFIKDTYEHMNRNGILVPVQ